MINESHPPLPTANFFGSQAVPEDTPLFTADQMRSYADATCALRGAQKESGWRPIETAPRDGTPIIALVNRFATEAWFSAIWGRFVRTETGGTHLMAPTHWMPLPTPPTPEGEAK